MLNRPAAYSIRPKIWGPKGCSLALAHEFPQVATRGQLSSFPIAAGGRARLPLSFQTILGHARVAAAIAPYLAIFLVGACSRGPARCSPIRGPHPKQFVISRCGDDRGFPFSLFFFFC